MHTQRNRNCTSLDCASVELACTALILNCTAMQIAAFVRTMCAIKVMQDV